MTLADKALGELADKGRLADPVDTHDQHHVGALRSHLERFRHRREYLDEFPGQCLAQLPGVAQFAAGNAVLDRIDDPRRRVNADVRHEQDGLEFVQKIRVNRPLAKDQIADTLGNPLTRLGE